VIIFLVHLIARHLDAVINYYYTASLHVDVMSSMSIVLLPVTWPSREKKRVKCEGPPSLDAVYQNIGVWRRRVIARLTWNNPWHVIRVLHSLHRYMLVVRTRTCSWALIAYDRLIYLLLRVLPDVCKPLATESFEFPRDMVTSVLFHLPSTNILLGRHLPGYAATPLCEHPGKRNKNCGGDNT